MLQSLFCMLMEDNLCAVDSYVHAILMPSIWPVGRQSRPPNLNFRQVILAKGKNNFVIAVFNYINMFLFY